MGVHGAGSVRQIADASREGIAEARRGAHAVVVDFGDAAAAAAVGRTAGVAGTAEEHLAGRVPVAPLVVPHEPLPEEHKAVGTPRPEADTDCTGPAPAEVEAAAARQVGVVGSGVVVVAPADAVAVVANLRRSRSLRTVALDRRGERRQRLLVLFVTRSTARRTRQQLQVERVVRPRRLPNTQSSPAVRVVEVAGLEGEEAAEGCMPSLRKGSCSLCIAVVYEMGRFRVNLRWRREECRTNTRE